MNTEMVPEINNVSVLKEQNREDLFSKKEDVTSSEDDCDNFVKFAMSHINRIENSDLWSEEFWIAVYNYQMKVKKSSAKFIFKEFSNSVFLLIVFAITYCIFPAILLGLFLEGSFEELLRAWNFPLGLLLFVFSSCHLAFRICFRIGSKFTNIYLTEKLVKKQINSTDVLDMWNAYVLAKKGIVTKGFLQIPGEPVHFKLLNKSRNDKN